MTGKNTLSRFLLICSLSLGAFALAQAQTPPPGAGGDKPAGGTAKPGDAKPAGAKPPEKFHSPFNGDLDPNGGEAQDFGKLLDRYDAMLDAQAALAAAEKCNGDTKKAKEDLDKAAAAFNEAFDEYVIGWDMGSGSITLNYYHQAVKDHSKPYMKGGKAQKTLDALKDADKKKHDAAACPPPAGTPAQPVMPGTTPKTGADVAPEHSGLPPKKFHSALNGDIAPDSGEARDFAGLLDLYDAMLDAEAALKAAEKCNGDTKKAKEDLDKATARFNESFDEYVIGWDTHGGMSLVWYREHVRDHSRPYEKGPEAASVLDALKAADRKTHDAAACPPPAGDVAPEHSSLPPCDDGDKVAARIEGREVELAEIMEDERTADDATLARLKTQEASLREELAGLNGLKACPSDYHPPEEESGSPSISIGIGIGVGGGDRHGHRDRDDGDRPRDDHPPAEHRD